MILSKLGVLVVNGLFRVAWKMIRRSAKIIPEPYHCKLFDLWASCYEWYSLPPK